MSTLDTKERILDAAERLFAERGFAGTSLRSVTKSAGVNLAAIHYHFGAKEALLREVFARRAAPVNQERLRLLDELEKAAPGRAVALESILDAFLRPVMHLQRDLAADGDVWGRLIGRVYSEPVDLVEAVLKDQFVEVSRRFMDALTRSLPELPDSEIHRRMQFVIGALTHSLTGLHRMADLPELGGEGINADGSLDSMLAFLTAGFRAPLRGNRGRAADETTDRKAGGG
jgi:AcrR family transcriptional regulator